MNHWAATVETRPMTPEEVLEVFNFRHRREFVSDEAEPARFDMPMSLEAWAAAWGPDFCELDLVDIQWNWFGCHIPPEEWAETFRDPATATVGDVCVLIARHAEIEHVQPLQIAGTTSTQAGMFLAILHLMERVGIDTRGIKPSDPLLPWLMHSSHRLLPELMRLFPGRLPETEVVRHPLTRAGGALCAREAVSLVVAAIIAWLTEAMEVLLTSVAGLVFGIASVALGERLCPTHERFAQEVTFRDLCRRLAES